jgi:hypothetical protein
MLPDRKGYLIDLHKKRSILALIAGICVFVCTFAAVFWGLQAYAGDGESLFHYFTVLSNLVAAVGAAFMIPYAVEGIRRKRFVLPRWVTLFQYCGSVGVAITMVSAICIILPYQGARAAFGGMSFWLHLVSPLMTLILFQCVESEVLFRVRDLLVTMIPYWIYMLVYFVNVYLVGKWEDIYSTKDVLPPWTVAVLMIGIGFAVSAVLLLIHNRRARRSARRLMRCWDKRMEPAELKIEAFGLGRYMGMTTDGDELSVPVDIFEMMTERYDVTLEELTRAYMKGALDGMEEKKRSR